MCRRNRKAAPRRICSLRSLYGSAELCIVEETSGVSPEGANGLLVQNFLIGNPYNSADSLTNEQEVAYDPAVGSPATCPLDYGA